MGQSSSKKDFKLDNSKGSFEPTGSIKRRIEADVAVPSGMPKSSLRTSVPPKPQPAVVEVVIAENSVAMTTDQPEAQSNNEVVPTAFLLLCCTYL